MNLLDTQAINYELVKDCDDTDRKKFEDLIKRADLLRVLNYDKMKALKTDADIITRYDCLKGELLAGNDNLDIRKELKDVVKLLCEKGKISKEDGRELMSELFG